MEKELFEKALGLEEPVYVDEIAFDRAAGSCTYT